MSNIANEQQISVNNKLALRQREEAESSVEIDLAELLIRILDRWYWVLVAALVGTIIAGVYTFFFVTPLYQSTSKLYVVNSKNSAINLSDLQIGNYLAKDYQEVFTNWHMHERVIEELNLPYTYSELNGMVKVSNPSDTRILYVTVTSADPEEARAMANMYAKVACEFVAVKMDQEQPNIFEEARLPAAPSSPNKTRNILLGFLLGALIAVAIITVRFISDDRVRTPEEIDKLLSLPTLGVVTEQESFRHGTHKTAKNTRK